MAGLVPKDWPHSSFATHVPLLTDLMLSFGPRRILEAGSGLYSTGFFLSFNIDRLVSVENNPEWAKDWNDPRHDLELVGGRVVDHLPNLDGFDLIFIDDDPVEARIKTIDHVLDRASCPVVIHDTSDARLHGFIANRANHTDTNQPYTTVVDPSDSKEFHAWLALR